MLITPASYEPKAVFSPSGLSRAQRCLHAWGLRYLQGIKKPELSWAEAAALPVPKAKVKSRPTDAERAEKKAYNAKYRPALGKEVHARFEKYYQGGAVDWNDKPGQIAIVGFEYLPHPDTCEVVEAEGEITIEVDGVKFRGFRDLLVLKDGRWLLIDHKTTFTFDFFDREKTLKTVKTPEQLQADTQANLYAYAAMRDKGLKQLDCRWVYYRTEDKPKACAVDFVITWESAKAVVDELVTLAKQLEGYVGSVLGGAIDARALVETLKKDPEACAGFGGCEYHSDREGPCTPPKLSPGERLVQIRLKQKARAALPPKPPKDTKKMGFRDKPKNAAASKPAPAPEPEVNDEADAASDETEETVDGGTQPEGTFAQDEAAETEAKAPPAPAPAPARKAPKTKAVVEASDERLTVSRGATELEVPAGSPFYKPLLKALKAVEDCQRALAGES